MTNKYNPIPATFCLLLMLLATQTRGQGDGQAMPPGSQERITGTEFFASDEIFEITLMFDITTFIRNKTSKEYLDAFFEFTDSTKQTVSTQIRLRPRGFRRNQICPFPPIRLNFNKAAPGFAELDSIGNVKLVTHCRDIRAYEKYVLKEFLAYKIFNIISDTSYRVRLVRVNYKDTGKKKIQTTKFGFIIEPDEVMEERFNVKELENIIVRHPFAEKDAMDRMTVFNLMIGNVDYQLETLHNVKTFKPNDLSNLLSIVLPYDFDYAGLVNTHYAVPSEGLSIQHVTQRLFLGPCRTTERFQTVIDEFLGHKDEIIEVVKNFQYLKESERNKMILFLNEFFTMCEDGTALSKMKSECKDYK